MKVCALRLTMDESPVSWWHSVAFFSKVNTFPCSMVDTILMSTPWALFGNEFAAGKLFVSSVKRSIHGYSKERKFIDWPGAECVGAAVSVHVC